MNGKMSYSGIRISQEHDILSKEDYVRGLDE